MNKTLEIADNIGAWPEYLNVEITTGNTCSLGEWQ